MQQKRNQHRAADRHSRRVVGRDGEVHSHRPKCPARVFVRAQVARDGEHAARQSYHLSHSVGRTSMNNLCFPPNRGKAS